MSITCKTFLFLLYIVRIDIAPHARTECTNHKINMRLTHIELYVDMYKRQKKKQESRLIYFKGDLTKRLEFPSKPQRISLDWKKGHEQRERRKQTRQAH